MIRPCSVAGCDRDATARGFCPLHYYRWKTNGDPLVVRRVHAYPADAICSVEGCKRRAEDRGMCGMHRQRVRRYGDPQYLTPEEVRRANNRTAQPTLGKCKPTTYRKLFGRHEHRRVAEAKIGRELGPDEIVHHADENRHNNADTNLDLVSRRQHILIHRAQMQAAKRAKARASR